ncbi:MAG: hypothetical protein KF764_10540 [Labilithrix sp.]|nr:hypothetical protein [Labilithrix sp.]
MTLRKGHGRGAGQPRIEVLPADELPAPVPALEPVSTRPVTRRKNGTIADSASAKEIGRRGGLARMRKARLVSALGLAELAVDAAFAPYRRAGDEFVRAELEKLATQAGGEVGPGPSSIVASAGLQLAASRFVSDKAAASGDAALFQTASKLANDSRQNLLAAYELAVREAKARRDVAPVTPWLVAKGDDDA